MACYAYYGVLMALLMLSHEIFCHAKDCDSVGQEAQFNLTEVAHTWQPDGKCPWLQSPSSGTGNLPPTERSGPRWLVVQLRRPMLLERVSVQSWGGEWQTAGEVGSRVSAFGAASLPLELQLQDPCRASWDAFGGWGGWRRVGEAGDETPVAFVLINATREMNSISLLNLSGTGRHSHIELLGMDGSDVGLRLLSLKEDSTVGLQLHSSCRSSDSERLSCLIRSTSGQETEIPLRSNSGKINVMRLTPRLDWHGGLLSCCYGQQRSKCPIQRTIGIVFIAKLTRLLASPVWVVGHNATVEFQSNEEYPKSQHSCRFSGGEQLPLLREVQIQSDGGRTSFSSKSTCKFLVERSMLNERIECKAEIAGSIVSLHRGYQVLQISEPCDTHLELNSSGAGWHESNLAIVRVISRNCSIWPVQHTCRLIGAEGIQSLERFEESNFNSSHRLRMRGWLPQSDWSLRCSVNQSGVLYTDVQLSPYQLSKLQRKRSSIVRPLTRPSQQEQQSVPEVKLAACLNHWLIISIMSAQAALSLGLLLVSCAFIQRRPALSCVSTQRKPPSTMPGKHATRMTSSTPAPAPSAGQTGSATCEYDVADEYSEVAAQTYVNLTGRQ